MCRRRRRAADLARGGRGGGGRYGGRRARRHRGEEGRRVRFPRRAARVPGRGPRRHVPAGPPAVRRPVRSRHPRDFQSALCEAGPAFGDAVHERRRCGPDRADSRSRLRAADLGRLRNGSRAGAPRRLVQKERPRPLRDRARRDRDFRRRRVLEAVRRPDARRQRLRAAHEPVAVRASRGGGMPLRARGPVSGSGLSAPGARRPARPCAGPRGIARHGDAVPDQARAGQVHACGGRAVPDGLPRDGRPARREGELRGRGGRVAQRLPVRPGEGAHRRHRSPARSRRSTARGRCTSTS